MTAKFKTANVFAGAGITKTAKFNARQYFCVYGMAASMCTQFLQMQSASVGLTQARPK